MPDRRPYLPLCLGLQGWSSRTSSGKQKAGHKWAGKPLSNAEHRPGLADCSPAPTAAPHHHVSPSNQRWHPPLGTLDCATGASVLDRLRGPFYLPPRLRLLPSTASALSSVFRVVSASSISAKQQSRPPPNTIRYTMRVWRSNRGGGVYYFSILSSCSVSCWGGSGSSKKHASGLFGLSAARMAIA